MQHIIQNKKENAFTIIELIISIFILSIAIIGIFSAFSIVTILTSDSSDRLTAAYLAQEGMEIVRNIRDTNWLNMDICAYNEDVPESVSCPASWVDGLTDCSVNGCELDYRTTGYNSNPIVPYMGSYLNIDTSGFYSYAAGTSTKFKRKIIITPVIDLDGSLDYHIISVRSLVSWDKKADIINPAVSADICSASNCIAAEEMLYNWYNYINQ